MTCYIENDYFCGNCQCYKKIYLLLCSYSLNRRRSNLVRECSPQCDPSPNQWTNFILNQLNMPYIARYQNLWKQSSIFNVILYTLHIYIFYSFLNKVSNWDLLGLITRMGVTRIGQFTRIQTLVYDYEVRTENRRTQEWIEYLKKCSSNILTDVWATQYKYEGRNNFPRAPWSCLKVRIIKVRNINCITVNNIRECYDVRNIVDFL